MNLVDELRCGDYLVNLITMNFVGCFALVLDSSANVVLASLNQVDQQYFCLCFSHSGIISIYHHVL